MSRRRTRFEIMRRNRQCIQFEIGRMEVEAEVAWKSRRLDLVAERVAKGQSTDQWIEETREIALQAARGLAAEDDGLVLPTGFRFVGWQETSQQPGLLRRFWNWLAGSLVSDKR